MRATTGNPRRQVRWLPAAILMLATVQAMAVQPPDQIDETGPAEVVLTGVHQTGEALWPVPKRAQWGKVTTQKGPNIWQDAVFTDPDGRWQVLYPSTMTDRYGGYDDGERSRMYRYPGQRHISCAVYLHYGVFDDLGADAPVASAQALLERRDALVAKAADGRPVDNVQIIGLPVPPGTAGRAPQAIMFDQRGKLLQALGVDREVVARHVLFSDDDDLLQVTCTAHPGQKKWVDKQVPVSLRPTVLIRERRE